jgi:hypothetical protein
LKRFNIRGLLRNRANAMQRCANSEAAHGVFKDVTFHGPRMITVLARVKKRYKNSQSYVRMLRSRWPCSADHQ